MELLRVNRLSASVEKFLHQASKGPNPLNATAELYEVRGKILYGIFGIVTPALLSRKAAAWFVLLPEADPDFAELRQAKRDINIPAMFPEYDIYADIKVGDKRAATFARFFGLSFLTTEAGFDIYTGVK